MEFNINQAFTEDQVEKIKKRHKKIKGKSKEELRTALLCITALVLLMFLLPVNWIVSIILSMVSISGIYIYVESLTEQSKEFQWWDNPFAENRTSQVMFRHLKIHKESRSLAEPATCAQLENLATPIKRSSEIKNYLELVMEQDRELMRLEYWLLKKHYLEMCKQKVEAI